MNRIFIIIMLVVLSALAACSANPEELEQPTAEVLLDVSPTITATSQLDDSSEQVSMVSYSKDIVPLMFAHCTSCHGTEKISRNLDLRTYASTIKGSQNGAVVIPGDSDASLLTKQIIDGKMPKRGPKLSDEEKNLFIQWVNQGALDN